MKRFVCRFFCNSQINNNIETFCLIKSASSASSFVNIRRKKKVVFFKLIIYYFVNPQIQLQKSKQHYIIPKTDVVIFTNNFCQKSNIFHY